MLASKTEDFSKKSASKRPSKFLSFLASIFYRFWLRLGLQLGSILGAKTPHNRKHGCKKKVVVLPKSGSEYDLAFEHRSRAFWPRFLGDQGSIFDDFGMIFRASWLTLGMFSAALGAVFSRLHQKDPRTCQGHSREQIRTDDYRKHQTSKLSSSKFLF